MLARSRVLLCLLAAALTGLAPASGQRAKRLAEKAYDLSDYPEAVEMYERLSARRAVDAQTRLRHARALRIVGRLDEAADVLAEVGETDDPEVPYLHARVLMELGRYPEAVEAVFAAARANHPGADALAERLEYAQAHQDDASGWAVTGEFANSGGDDFAPAVMGDVVVFASRRDGEPLTLYRAGRDENDFLRVPRRLHRVGPLPGGDAPVAYSPSGQLVALTRNNFAAGERLLPEAGWELSLALALPSTEGDFLPGKAFVHNSSGSSSGFPSFSADGKRLYFASDRPGGKGGYDVYYVERERNGWGAPVNAGPSVNTPGNEISPNAESGALYFASDYLPGFGGMDIYRADLVGGRFSSVTNLGPEVNSPLDDIGFALSADGRFGYLASNRAGGKGGMDLYRAKRTGTAVTLAVVDGKSGAPVPNAILDFSDCGQGVFLTGADGAYTFRALPSLQCRPVVRKSGFNAKQFSVDGERLAVRPRIEIVLNPEDKVTIYEGMVVHSRTGDVVPGARVSARHARKDFTADATTDARGRYTLGLERDGDYVIAYDADGMAGIDREVSTYDGDGAGVLSTFAMFPAPGAKPAAPTREMTTGETPGPATVSTPYDAAGVTASGRPAVANAPVPGVPAEATAPPRPSPRRRVASGTVADGFAIQVAALKPDAADLAEYERRLGSVGRVYGRPEGGLLKVRVGPFPDRAAAAAAIADVRARGFSDAWVATERGGGTAGVDAPDSPAAAAPYAVRLATYRSLGSFDRDRAGAIGTVSTRPSGEYVIALLTGYTSAEAAQAARAEAVAAGFPGAQVVREGAGGILRVVR